MNPGIAEEIMGVLERHLVVISRMHSQKSTLRILGGVILGE